MDHQLTCRGGGEKGNEVEVLDTVYPYTDTRTYTRTTCIHTHCTFLAVRHRGGQEGKTTCLEQMVSQIPMSARAVKPSPTARRRILLQPVERKREGESTKGSMGAVQEGTCDTLIHNTYKHAYTYVHTHIHNTQIHTIHILHSLDTMLPVVPLRRGGGRIRTPA